ncbi:MAG TPA: NADH-quinone oxidoreductase subunit M [Anaerolineales bacterium]|nr:NADH-quinone oxidoreductase subunit M [Anaerolineales bacterium]
MPFPFLSVIVFTPILAGLLLLMIPGERKAEIRVTALAAAFIAMILSTYVYFAYDSAVGGYQFIEKYTWIPQLGISFHVGVDGMSAPLVLLTGVVMFTGVLISWGIDDRPREFFAFLFILASGVFGVFVALDLFGLFFFYEIAVFPMYLLISIWGWKVTREYAAMKLTLYLFIGSVIALVGALAMYFGSGLSTFDMLALEKANFSPEFQRFWFPFVFFGFAVLGGIFPFHNWSPDGHVAAPTAVSMFHAGVLMKLGAFAALRVGIMLLPEGARFHLPWIIVLTLVNVVYGAFIAMVQTDFKYVIGFSSVSHMGLVLMGFATLTREGFLGSGVQMFSHGIMTALFFAVVGMVYDQAHTREIPKLGGFARIMPVVAAAFIVGGLVSMGMPGFSGFIAEFPIFMGLWRFQPWIAITASISIVVTAAYIIRVIGRVFFGQLPEEFDGHVRDVTVLDKVALGLLSVILISIGVFPMLMVPLVQSGVDNVLRLFGGA